MSLVEVMVALGIFMLLAGGALTAVVQSRKMAEDNVAQSIARTVAQGIIEQARSAPGLTMDTNATSLPLRFAKVGTAGANFAGIEQKTIPFAASATDFSSVGAPSIPSDLSSPGLGVLLDVESRKPTGQVIRPARYMPMEVSLMRVDNSSLHRYVAVALRYRWQPPTRNHPGVPPTWMMREIRTIIPYTSTP
jgi:type II secretory pathway pseudopilin PulG